MEHQDAKTEPMAAMSEEWQALALRLADHMLATAEEAPAVPGVQVPAAAMLAGMEALSRLSTIPGQAKKAILLRAMERAAGANVIFAPLVKHASAMVNVLFQAATAVAHAASQTHVGGIAGMRASGTGLLGAASLPLMLPAWVERVRVLHAAGAPLGKKLASFFSLLIRDVAASKDSLLRHVRALHGTALMVLQEQLMEGLQASSLPQALGASEFKAFMDAVALYAGVVLQVLLADGAAALVGSLLSGVSATVGAVAQSAGELATRLQSQADRMKEEVVHEIQNFLQQGSQAAEQLLQDFGRCKEACCGLMSARRARRYAASAAAAAVSGGERLQQQAGGRPAAVSFEPRMAGMQQQGARPATGMEFTSLWRR